MKRILIPVAITVFLCSTAIAGQGGGGESTKKGSSKKKAVTKKRTSGTPSANTAPPTRPPAPVPSPTTSSATAPTTIPPASVAEPVEALVLVAECTTPCTLHVDWGQALRTGGSPVRIKFNGKTRWYLFPGSGPVPLSEFATGEAQFASPENDSTPVRVRILSSDKEGQITANRELALVPEQECTTPCSLNFGYSKRIWGSGHPLRIKFKGVDHAVDYPAESRPCELVDLRVPEGWQPGEAFFVSPDEKGPHIRVRVFDRKTVCGR